MYSVCVLFTAFCQATGLPVIQRSLDGMVSMPGVGAVETVGLGESQTIMIIQDDNIASLHESTQVNIA
mgnify:CR=1 FL=1